MVDLLREGLGVEAKLVRGSGGIFTVAVGGEVVAQKSWRGFPSEKDVLEAVRAKLAPV